MKNKKKTWGVFELLKHKLLCPFVKNWKMISELRFKPVVL